MIRTKLYTTALSRTIPEGQSGRFKIVKTLVHKGTRMRTYSPMGSIYFDKYDGDFPMVKLIEVEEGEPDTVWMSDTAMEQEAMRPASIAARGDVLIAGLGLGLLPTMMKMHNKKVKSVTILEREQDVANLVYDHIKTRKTRLLVCDAKDYFYDADRKYDFIFIDIWGAFITPLKEGELWSAQAHLCLKEGGKVRFWMQELHERIKDSLPKEPAMKSGPAAIRDPCLVCAKTLRFDFAGLCMDCADVLGVSEMFVEGG